MNAFPILLDVRGKLAVVVGAGGVGLRRARLLLEAGAEVRLVDPAVPEDVPAGATALREAYGRAHLEGAALAVACTGDRAVNARVAEDARTAGIWVNVADEPSDSDFTFPASFTDGPVTVAVGTGGASPALAGRLVRHIESLLPARAGEFAQALGALREQARAEVPDPRRRRELLRYLAGEEGHNALLAGGQEALRECMRQWLREAR